MRSLVLVVGCLLSISFGGVLGLLTAAPHGLRRAAATNPTCPRRHDGSFSSGGIALRMGLSREDEIRRKIMKLKQQGKLKKKSSSSSPMESSPPPSVAASYEKKIKQKLGSKSKLLSVGYTSDDDDDEEDVDEATRIQAELDAEEEDDDTEDENDNQRRQGRIGYLPELQREKEARDEAVSSSSMETMITSSSDGKPIIDPSLFKEESSSEPEMSEEELLEKVAMKLAEKRRLEDLAQEERFKKLAADRKAKQEAAAAAEAETKASEDTTSDDKKKMMTSGVGGRWVKDDAAAKKTETYKPKTGSWGAFERPKDISKAYGGGRRIGAGYSKEEDEAAAMNTKRLLQEYRRKVGIDVPSEKEHAAEIEEALQLGQLAMQRGVYATAVSALEKVTKWCSTNSPVGSKVFLELAMAYEAVGRTEEAMKVYQVLSKCRMEDVKYNAKKLLYGMEAMGVMREISSDFSRQKVKNTFIDATGLRDIAQNFDDRYNTAYIDLNSGYYKKLTESVVRSNREARQILLKAVGKGEVSRTRIVQALRSMARHFDDALEIEIQNNKVQEPTAYIDGKPLFANEPAPSSASSGISTNLDEYVLASPEQMLENLQGKWRLQLLADKSGDGVSFFNQTTAIQDISADLSFEATGPSGLVSVTSSGTIVMDDTKRIISRQNVQEGGGGFLGGIFGGGKDLGFSGAVSRQQQIMSVDSVLMITKSPFGSRKGKDAEKEHFTVWRKITTDMRP